MKFENIGGSSTRTQHSLHDFSEDPNGETIMSIEIHAPSGNWWFVGNPKDELTAEHMKALRDFLNEQLPD